MSPWLVRSSAEQTGPFVLAWMSPEGSPGSERNAATQLLALTNEIRDRARYFGADKRQGGQQVSQSQLNELPASHSPQVYFDASGRFEGLEREIRRLPEEMRQVLILRTVDGLPSREVAKKIGKSDAAVRKIYSRAVAQLATHLGEEDSA